MTNLYCLAHRDVHRIKVDEILGLLITTHTKGGIRVTDVKTGKLLWRLSLNYVRPYAHLEYERGFMIFDRMTNEKEVWRLSTNCDLAQMTPASPPDAQQMEEYQKSIRRFPDITRGHFRPWALFGIPEPTTAYRFVYPTLVTMSRSTAYLCDVPTGQFIREIQGIQDGDVPLGRIAYVELSAQYVFVCGMRQFRVFSRANGAQVLWISNNQPTFAHTRIQLEADQDARAKEFDQVVSALHARLFSTPKVNPPPLNFVAVHVSRSGRDLVILMDDNRLLLVQDFERIIKDEVELTDVALEVHLPNQLKRGSSVYLAYEHGRVSVVTASGVYILTLDVARHGLFDPSRFADDTYVAPGMIENIPSLPPDIPFPYLSAVFVPRLRHGYALYQVSCLQMTATKVFLTWDSRLVPRPRILNGRGQPDRLREQDVEYMDGFLLSFGIPLGEDLEADEELDEDENAFIWEEDLDTGSYFSY
ncbi:uncharacterized protein FIBRA_06106 [Fibroporia radiculosa]|uniref:ER membrane protein complex subunit 1 n=1 Tax=Fibroporia radiculosa TaxID=599839 RepID=J4GAN9_9APHY|nr:uncharacterized protein FIBRA_06106 [Fibroporia radiculosa]CCM03953.1 predicted protein [Fibroporia radiculosa]